MRIAIELRAMRNGILGWDYHYAVGAWIYHLLQRAAPEYAERLHNHGYALDEHRRTRLFTFSLSIQAKETCEAGFVLTPGTHGRLIISSPIEEAFIVPVVEALLQGGPIEFTVPPHRAVWHAEQVDVLPQPRFGEYVVARLLSPVVVSVPAQPYPQYLLPLDARVPALLATNACKKYRAVTGCKPDGAIRFEVDRTYIARHGGEQSRQITRLRRIKVGRPDETAIRGFIAPIHLYGDPQVITVLYDCGIGEKNSMGFGYWVPMVPSP